MKVRIRYSATYSKDVYVHCSSCCHVILFPSSSKDVLCPLFKSMTRFSASLNVVFVLCSKLPRIRFSFFIKIMSFRELMKLLIILRVHDDKLSFFVCDIFCGVVCSVLSVVENLP